MSGDPFQIYPVAGFGTGTLGLCKQPATDADFAEIADWNPTVVVTLTCEDEFPDMAQSLPVRFLHAEYDWLHLPVADYGVPDSSDTDLWCDALAQMQAVLAEDGRVLAHCKGGRGRSGMVLLRLLTLQGEDGANALGRIRNIRSGAVETDAQYNWATKPL
jgi:protein tyrosine phosphatase (PTP) superfamily phosphohydrolase (DUF442 family)